MQTNMVASSRSQLTKSSRYPQMYSCDSVSRAKAWCKQKKISEGGGMSKKVKMELTSKAVRRGSNGAEAGHHELDSPP